MLRTMGIVAAGVLCSVAVAFAAPAPNAKAPTNLFANPGFELGQQFWQLGKGGKTVATWEVRNDEHAEGLASALLSIDTIDSWGVQFGQSIDGVAQGKTYTFAALARAVGDPVPLRLEIERRADPYDRAARSDAVTVTSDKWTEIHVTFPVTKPFKEGWSAYVSCMTPKAKFRLDAFRLYEGEYVPFAQQQREASATAGVRVFDTTTPAGEPLSGTAVAKHEGWTALAEDDLTHAFKGDTVVTNGRLALVLRAKGAGGEVYALAADGATPQAVLKPVSAGTAPGGAAGAAASALAGVKLLENNPGQVTLEAAFRAADGKVLPLRFTLQMGQVFVKAEPATAGGVAALRVEAPCRFAVMPDFFADDIVVDATALPVTQAELPSENFLLNLLPGGQALVMSVWTYRDQDITVALNGQAKDKRIDSADLPYGKDGKAWVAVLAAPNIWHTRDLARADAGQIIPLDWRPPLPAAWRIDWRRDDQLADSWEMLVQQPSGDFVKYGLLGSGERLPDTRKRWTTVFGSFTYPCWIDKQGQGYVQPLKTNVLHWEGPAVIYPFSRTTATPLDTFTVVDVVRGTLGVGPCEYILDLEGQRSEYKGRATCANRDTLNPIYQKGQQKERRAEVEKSLAEVIVFIRHIRGRIQGYVDFGHEIRQYLAQQKQSHPELAKPLDELDALAKRIDTYVAQRRDAIKTPDEAAAMIEAFRKDGLDDTGPGAFDKCKKFTAAIVDIGGNQDELVGEGRLAVKLLRQRAGLLMATDPGVAEVAREIRARSQKVLRTPAGHEGARH